MKSTIIFANPIIYTDTPMILLPRNKTLNSRVRTLQDLCGCIFIALSALNFILFYFFPKSQFPIGGVILMGILALLGFGFLYVLASSLISDLFAASQFACELFFGTLFPLMMFGIVPQDVILYILCMVFCALSIFFWTQLFYNHKFARREICAIVLLPIPTVINFIIYYSYLHAPSSYIFDVLAAIQYMPVKVLMMLYLCWGYWTLSHSSAFSSNKSDEDDLSLNPFNIYTLGYIAVLLAILFL